MTVTDIKALWVEGLPPNVNRTRWQSKYGPNHFISAAEKAWSKSFQSIIRIDQVALNYLVQNLTKDKAEPLG